MAMTWLLQLLCFTLLEDWDWLMKRVPLAD
jgi:hypothetical protein